MYDYWQKQTNDKPLYPDLIWSRPETKQTAGKLLIVGGNVHGFSAAANAYNQAVKAGIGTVRIVLPDVLQKTVGPVMPEAVFVASTPSGSFAQKALDGLLSESQWADGTLLAGDFGRNSETAILLEKFVDKYPGLLTLTKDSIDYFKHIPQKLLERPQTCLVLTIAQLQQLAKQAKYPQPFTFDMDMTKLVEVLHNFTERYPVNIVLKQLDSLYLAVKCQVITMPAKDSLEDSWRINVAASTMVWWLQNPSKTLEALSSALIDLTI